MIRDSFIYKRHFAHIAFALECGTPLVVDGCKPQSGKRYFNAKHEKSDTG